LKFSVRELTGPQIVQSPSCVVHDLNDRGLVCRWMAHVGELSRYLQNRDLQTVWTLSRYGLNLFKSNHKHSTATDYQNVKVQRRKLQTLKTESQSTDALLQSHCMESTKGKRKRYKSIHESIFYHAPKVYQLRAGFIVQVNFPVTQPLDET